uniref:RNA-directed RNA polymerase C-terminal domain-containing protein n=1 Tax=Skokie reo-like virus TaxID=2789444 RepID=A0A7S9KIG7_9REOV|nr:hypothetical protein [Skokie reo-like virus]
MDVHAYYTEELTDDEPLKKLNSEMNFVKHDDQVKIAKDKIDKLTTVDIPSLDEILQCGKALSRSNALWTEDTLELIDKVGLAYRMFPEILLEIAKVWKKPPDKIARYIDSGGMFATCKDASFKYDPITQRTLPSDIRYMYNENLHDLGKGGLESKLNMSLFHKLGGQGRWGNIWMEILSATLYMDDVTEELALGRLGFFSCRNEPRGPMDLLTIQTIMYILRRWNNFPFFVTPRGVVVNPKFTGECSTCVLPLLYSLLELSSEERMFNTVDVLTEVMIMERLSAAKTSFESHMLNNKGTYPSFIPLITTQLSKSIKIRYSGWQEIVTELENVDEYIPNGSGIDVQGLERKCKSDHQELWKLINRMRELDSAERTETARWLIMWCLSAGNPGIYYRTSLVLEYEKSVGAQIHEVIQTPKRKSLYLDQGLEMTLQYDWESISGPLKFIHDRYAAEVEKIVPKLRNMEEYYVSLLTSNSQGQKVDPRDVVVENVPEVLRAMNSVKQKRIAAFTFNRDPYESYIEFKKSLMRDGICTIRFQNDRRARIVEIVPNQDQIGWAVVLAVFEEIKKNDVRMAVGKQKGSVYDMMYQLEATGDGSAVVIYSDVSGADASTQPFLATLFGQIIAEELIKHSHTDHRYFACHTEEVIDTNMSRHIIPALGRALLAVINTRAQKNYLLKDPITNVSMKIKPAIFESGRYDTSAQHTTMYTYAHEYTYNQYKNTGPKWQISARKFGDDSIEIARSISNVPDFNDLDEYIRMSSEDMKKLGFKIEINASRFYGDFLQQSALNGRVVPKSARSSIYTDERQNSTNRDVIDRIGIVANVVNAAAQRGYAPENLMSLTKQAWAIIRHERFRSDHLLKMRGFRLWPEIKMFSYPMTLIFFPPMNTQNPNLLIDGVYLPRSSHLRTVGNSKLVWIINKLTSDIEKTMLLTFREDGKYVSAYSLLKDRLETLGIRQALILQAYSRSGSLSKTREELLEKEIYQMAERLGEYKNQRKRMKSLQAIGMLKTMGIQVPDSISYYHRPITRIKDLFASVSESVIEAEYLNDQLILYLNRYSKISPRDIRLSVEVAALHIKYSGEQMELFDICEKYPLLPGYRSESDWGRALRMMGHPIFSRGRVGKIFGTYSKYGNSFPLDLAIKKGVEALAHSEVAFGLFVDAIDIPEQHKTEFKNLVMSSDVIAVNDYYNSGFQQAELFGINGLFDPSQTLINFSDIVPNSIQNQMRVMVRDFLLYDLPHAKGELVNVSCSLAGLEVLNQKHFRRIRERSTMIAT